MPGGDHRIPAVAVIDAAVVADCQPSSRSSVARPTGSARRYRRRRRRGVAVGREPRDRRLEERRARAARRERLGVEQRQQRAAAQITVEVLHRQRAVGEHDERVVRPRPRQLARGEHVEIGRQPVTVAAVHDVQRPVRVRGDPAGPERAAGQLGRAGDRRERQRIDPLDPRIRRIPSGRLPSVWRRTNTSPGSRRTTIVVANASRRAVSRSVSPVRRPSPAGRADAAGGAVPRPRRATGSATGSQLAAPLARARVSRASPPPRRSARGSPRPRSSRPLRRRRARPGSARTRPRRSERERSRAPCAASRGRRPRPSGPRRR